MNLKRVLLSFGEGGEETQSFLDKFILKYLGNTFLNSLEDSTPIYLSSRAIAFTTDSFTVKPLFFKGGDIGKLSVVGTVNDLAVMGAKPKFLSLSLIIEEGFLLEDLEKILQSIKEEAEKNEVFIVTGDTKVVPRGAADGLFINTSGIGEILYPGLSAKNLKPGDLILVSGTLGDHGVCILAEREDFQMEINLKSDCASLYPLLEPLFLKKIELHALRDPTRGGLSGILHEWAKASKVDILVYEEKIPVKPQVRTFCEIFGFEPYHLPSEGKVVIALPKESLKDTLKILKSHSLGEEAEIIGEVLSYSQNPKVFLQTPLGTRRLLEQIRGELLPRIC
ncbi:MAG: hydrogenase expression/formation protein HypE [Caldimicrobium sp.]